MKKQLNIVIGISIFLCFLLLVSIISFNLKESNAVIAEETSNEVDITKYDYNKSFDVSDFSFTKENTIDIPSKRYINNAISLT